jgi:hypothetical protein
MKINGVEVSAEDYIQLAEWAYHLEKENTTLKQQNEELKSNMLMVLHQRNSLNKRLEEMKNQVAIDNLNTIETVLVSDVDLTNPEQYRLVQTKPSKPKTELDIN